MVEENPCHEPPHKPNLPTRPPERWLTVSGYEGLYEVSDRGQIRRVNNGGKLSTEAVGEARILHRHGMSYGKLALSFGVTKAAMRKALTYQYKRMPLREANRILRPLKSTHGYAQIGLCRDGRVSLASIHSLVAQAFLGKRWG